MLSQNNIMGCVMNAPLDTITIPLTKGYSTVIDAVDADIACFHWTAMVKKDGGIYAMRTTSKRTVYLHRLILGRKLRHELPRRVLTDHVNGQTLDNRRDNLREASTLQNCRNRGRQCANTSGVTGVSWNVKCNRWQASVCVNYKRIHLGWFADFDEAVAVRHAAEIEYYGEFSPLLSRQEIS